MFYFQKKKNKTFPHAIQNTLKTFNELMKSLLLTRTVLSIMNFKWIMKKTVVVDRFRLNNLNFLSINFI